GGFVVNCNNRPVGPVYSEPLPRYDWAQDRALRIDARLAARPRVTLRDLTQIQNDIYSRGAERFVPLLLASPDSLPQRLPPRMREARAPRRSWNVATARPQVAPTLARGWYGALQRRSHLEGLPGLTVAGLEGGAPEALEVPGGAVPERPAEAVIAALGL